MPEGTLGSSRTRHDAKVRESRRKHDSSEARNLDRRGVFASEANESLARVRGSKLPLTYTGNRPDPADTRSAKNRKLRSKARNLTAKGSDTAQGLPGERANPLEGGRSAARNRGHEARMVPEVGPKKAVLEVPGQRASIRRNRSKLPFCWISARRSCQARGLKGMATGRYEDDDIRPALWKHPRARGEASFLVCASGTLVAPDTRPGGRRNQCAKDRVELPSRQGSKPEHRAAEASFCCSQR
jgi:hypothetical protein